MVINPTKFKFDVNAYNLNKAGAQLRFAPINTALTSMHMKEYKVKKFFVDTCRELKNKTNLEEKVNFVDSKIFEFTDTFHKENKFIKYSEDEKGLIGDRWHEIHDNFINELRLTGLKATLGMVDMSLPEYDKEVVNTGKKILNSARRYEFFLNRGFNLNITPPKEIFRLALGFGEDFAKRRGVKIETRGNEILESFDNGIFVDAGNGAERAKDYKLFTVVSNLIQNAVKYTKANSTVTTEISKQNKLGKPVLSLSVKDSGIGVKSEDIEKILNGGRAQNAIDAGIPGSGHGVRRVNNILKYRGVSLEINSPLKPEIRDFPGSEFKFSVPVVED